MLEPGHRAAFAAAIGRDLERDQSVERQLPGQVYVAEAPCPSSRTISKSSICSPGGRACGRWSRRTGGWGTNPGGGEGAGVRKLGAAPVESSASWTSVASFTSETWLVASGVNCSVTAAGSCLQSVFNVLSSAMLNRRLVHCGECGASPAANLLHCITTALVHYVVNSFSSGGSPARACSSPRGQARSVPARPRRASRRPAN